jgi:hypothetical protein
MRAIVLFLVAACILGSDEGLAVAQHVQHLQIQPMAATPQRFDSQLRLQQSPSGFSRQLQPGAAAVPQPPPGGWVIEQDQPKGFGSPQQQPGGLSIHPDQQQPGGFSVQQTNQPGGVAMGGAVPLPLALQQSQSVGVPPTQFTCYTQSYTCSTYYYGQCGCRDSTTGIVEYGSTQ